VLGPLAEKVTKTDKGRETLRSLVKRIDDKKLAAIEKKMRDAKKSKKMSEADKAERIASLQRDAEAEMERLGSRRKNPSWPISRSGRRRLPSSLPRTRRRRRRNSRVRSSRSISRTWSRKLRPIVLPCAMRLLSYAGRRRRRRLWRRRLRRRQRKPR
jgi:hypothetical protein